MEHEIRQAFASVHASEQLKARTRQRLHRYYARPAAVSRAMFRPLYAAAACCLLCLGLVGWRLFFTVTSVISIDINPSLELSVNRFDRIIGVESYNPDGEALANGLQLLYKSYAQAVDEVLASETVTACLAGDGVLSIAVVETEPLQGEEILNYVTHCTASTPNAHCHSVQKEEADQAHELGLSYGRYALYIQICRYTDSLTPEQTNQMSMRQLRDLLTELQQKAGDALSDSADLEWEKESDGCSGSGPGQGSGGHHRHGQGR